MKYEMYIADSKEKLKSTIISILRDMWKLQEPDCKKVIVKSKDEEIVVADFKFGNFTVYWDNLIEAKQILKEKEKK